MAVVPVAAPEAVSNEEAARIAMFDRMEQSQDMLVLSHQQVNRQLLREVRRRKHKFRMPRLASEHSGKIDSTSVHEVDPLQLLRKLQRRPTEPPVTIPVAELLVRSFGKQLEELQSPVLDLRLPEAVGDGPRPVIPRQESRLIVVGDTHGQLQDVLHIFQEHGPPSASTTYLFNGDIVDRGKFAVEIWLLLIAFKLRRPDSVHVLRGNHENEQMISRPFKMGGGFSEECLSKYSRNLLSTFQRVFKLLPLFAVLQEEIFVVHGGLFRTPSVNLERLRSLPEAAWRCNFPNPLSVEEVERGKRWTDEQAIIFDAQWADPHFGKGLRRSSRGKVAVTFGEDVTTSFLDSNNLALCLRSHRVPQSGRGFDFEHGGRVLTLFSASRYGGVLRNRGAVAVLRHAGEELGERGGSSGSSAPPPTPPLRRLSMQLVEHEVEPYSIKSAAQVHRDNLRAARGLPPKDPHEAAGAQSQAAESVRRIVAQMAAEHEADVEQHALALICAFREELWRRCRTADERGTGAIPRDSLCHVLGEVCGEIGWDKLLESAAPCLEADAVAYGELLAAPRVRWFHLGAQQVINMARATLQAELTLSSLTALFVGASDGGLSSSCGGMVHPLEARKALSGLLPGLCDRQLRQLAATLFGDEPAPLSAVLHQLANFADPPVFSQPWMRPACERIGELIEQQFGPPPLHCAIIRFFQGVGREPIRPEDFIAAVGRLESQGSSADEVVSLTDARLKELFHAIDSNQSGTISFLELLLALDERERQPAEPPFPALEGALPALLYVHRLSLLPICRVLDKQGVGRVSALNFVELAAALTSVVGRPLQGASRKSVEDELRGEDIAFNEVLGSFEVTADGGPWRLAAR